MIYKDGRKKVGSVGKTSKMNFAVLCNTSDVFNDY